MKSSSFTPGQQLGRYRVIKLIAQGGMAEVYRAEQELTVGMVRPCALKVIRPEYSESEDFREMFLDEARCACQLSHSNIVHIYEVGEHDGLLYMAMELVPGETLATVNRTLRERSQRFADEAIFAIGIACASALEAVHTLELAGSHANLVHRDVSPHNLLLSSKGVLKLIDFGIAKAATNRNLTSPGVTKGKAGYFSPEQAMGKALDGRSDLFSLGITLYKLAAGVTPFDQHKTHQDRNGALVRGQWLPLDKVMAGLPKGLYEVVNKATRVNPDERYRTALEMREALEHAAYEAGFRVGQSSLLGYVTDDGEISAVPSGQRPVVTPSVPKPVVPSANGGATALARPARSSPTPPRERKTDRLMARAAAPSPPNRTVPVALVFAIAVALGIAATAVVVLATRRAQPVGQLTLAVPPPQPEVTDAAVPLERPEPPSSAVTTLTPSEDAVTAVDAGAAKAQVAATPVAAATTPRPKPLPPPKPKVVAAVERPVSEPGPIPAGEGKLRISTEPKDIVSRVLVDRVDWGMAPVSRPVPSGNYSVTVKLPDGKKSPEWRGPVMPESTTVLIYDVAQGRWQRR